MEERWKYYVSCVLAFKFGRESMDEEIKAMSVMVISCSCISGVFVS
jgi:hypothetical protein